MTAKQQAQLDRHEKQIEDLYKDVREIKNMNLKVYVYGQRFNIRLCCNDNC